MKTNPDRGSPKPQRVECRTLLARFRNLLGLDPLRLRRAAVRGASAFTLIELVISSALMVIIIAGAYACFTSGVASQKLIETRGDATQSARVALALITADLRAACPLSRNLEFLGMDRDLEDGTEADNLDFATHNYRPRRAFEGDFCEVSYFVSKDQKTGITSLYRRRDPTIDDEPLGGGSREELVSGVEGVRFEYYDGWEWFDEWGDAEGKRKAETSNRYQPNLTGMPEAVRVTIWVKPVSNSSAPDEENPEPGLAFQTVVRLNLARPSTTGETGGAGDQPQQEPSSSSGGPPQ
jgi:general secretion pathway protein J